MVPKRKDGLVNPLPVISHKRLGYLLVLDFGCPWTRKGSNRRRKIGVRFIKHLDSAGGEIFI